MRSEGPFHSLENKLDAIMLDLQYIIKDIKMCAKCTSECIAQHVCIPCKDATFGPFWTIMRGLSDVDEASWCCNNNVWYSERRGTAVGHMRCL